MRNLSADGLVTIKTSPGTIILQVRSVSHIDKQCFTACTMYFSLQDDNFDLF